MAGKLQILQVSSGVNRTFLLQDQDRNKSGDIWDKIRNFPIDDYT